MQIPKDLPDVTWSLMVWKAKSNVWKWSLSIEINLRYKVREVVNYLGCRVMVLLIARNIPDEAKDQREDERSADHDLALTCELCVSCPIRMPPFTQRHRSTDGAHDFPETSDFHWTINDNIRESPSNSNDKFANALFHLNSR